MSRKRQLVRSRRARLLLVALVVVLATAFLALAYFTAPGSGSGTAEVGNLNPPTEVTVGAPGVGTVPVNWTPSSTGGAVAPEGYFVTRTTVSSGATSPACGTSSSSPTTTLSCVDGSGTPSTNTPVLTGSYRYAVTAVFRSWSALSAPSGTVNVTGATTCDAGNEIACENQKPGNPESEWQIGGNGDGSIQGFATQISVDKGQTVGFKVDTDAADYRLDIYRLGWYGGNGARKVATVQPSATLPQIQPCVPDRCDNEAARLRQLGAVCFLGGARERCLGYLHRAARAPERWREPRALHRPRRRRAVGSALPDLRHHLAGLQQLRRPQPLSTAPRRSATTGRTTRALLSPTTTCSTPSTRWCAGWSGTATTSATSAAANGARAGAELLEHKTFMSVGHDEYWSGGQRANVEAARAAGVNLAFFSGNEVFWKTRWEPSIDGSNTDYRTLVTYKETHAGAKTDPLPNVWTGTWRDPRFSPPADGGRPENALTGTIFTVNGIRNDSIAVPAAEGEPAHVAEHAESPTWPPARRRRCPPARSATSGTRTSTTGRALPAPSACRTQGRSTSATPSSRTTAPATGLARPGTTWSCTGMRPARSCSAPARRNGRGAWTITTTRSPVRRSAAGGGWAHAAGDRQPVRRHAASSRRTCSPVWQRRRRRRTRLRRARRSARRPRVRPCRPATLLTISGTATDTGGEVGGVEVSVDNGQTWHPASGRATWSYSWTPSAIGSVTIKTRAVDDSGRLETPGNGVTVTVGVTPGTCPCTIWPSTQTANDGDDPNPIEVGVRFRADVAGFIRGVRFYKAPAASGTHVGSLWSNDGLRLAQATFTGESASGWQEVSFGSPIPIAANTTYVASAFLPGGHYAWTGGAFASAGVDRPPLRALRDGEDGASGVYRYGGRSGTNADFPTLAAQSSNYWVDVVFVTTTGPDTTPPVATSVSPADGATGVAVSANMAAGFNEALDEATISAASVELRGPSERTRPGDHLVCGRRPQGDGRPG